MANQLPQICGIQQVGIGNTSVYDTWEWYRINLGLNVPIFDEAAEAALMLPYTGGKPRERHAVLALNMMGGGGAEIWQYTSRVAEAPKFEISLGDLGTFIAKYKSPDINQSYEALKAENLLSQIETNPAGQKHFYLKDPFGNIIEIIEAKSWFSQHKFHCGGIYGVVNGVTDMQSAISFYQDILFYDQIVSDETDCFEDFKGLPGGGEKFRRVILTHSQKRKGPFSKLFGKSEIELVQALDRKPEKIFKKRLWGDQGYIHLCFDIVGMDEMRAHCKSKNSPFTVDSGDFDMGEAAGQFAYIEDPDGTLIEFVEALKVPIFKKIGWYLDLKKRDQLKDLPTWMIKALGLNKKTKPVNS